MKHVKTNNDLYQAQVLLWKAYGWPVSRMESNETEVQDPQSVSPIPLQLDIKIPEGWVRVFPGDALDINCRYVFCKDGPNANWRVCSEKMDAADIYYFYIRPSEFLAIPEVLEQLTDYVDEEVKTHDVPYLEHKNIYKQLDEIKTRLNHLSEHIKHFKNY
jgi:hypothetical protein